LDGAFLMSLLSISDISFLFPLLFGFGFEEINYKLITTLHLELIGQSMQILQPA